MLRLRRASGRRREGSEFLKNGQPKPLGHLCAFYFEMLSIGDFGHPLLLAGVSRIVEDVSSMRHPNGLKEKIERARMTSRVSTTDSAPDRFRSAEAVKYDLIST
jgi:hypothetical protein